MKHYTNYPYDWAADMINRIREFFKQAPMGTNTFDIPYFNLSGEERTALNDACEEMEWVLKAKKAKHLLDYFVTITPEQHAQIKQDSLLDPIEEDFK